MKAGETDELLIGLLGDVYARIEGLYQILEEALKELKLRRNVLVVSISRGGKTELPNGDSTFQRGETVIIVTSGRGTLRQINDIFAE